MKSFSTKLLTLLSGFLCCFLLVGQTAQPVLANEIEENLVKLEYTIDEIRQMSLGEYYSKLFPEDFNEFTEEEKKFLFNTPYPQENNLNEKGLINGWSSMKKISSTRLDFTVRTDIYTLDKAKKISHSVVMYDKSGTTWMIVNESGADTKSFATRGYKDIKTGNSYQIETVHTITMPSNYSPTISTSKSTSVWVQV